MFILFLKEGGGGEVYAKISSMYLPPPQGWVGGRYMLEHPNISLL